MFKKFLIMGYVLSVSLALAEVKGGGGLSGSAISGNGEVSSRAAVPGVPSARSAPETSSAPVIDPNNLRVECSMEYVMADNLDSELEWEQFESSQQCGLLISNRWRFCTQEEKDEGCAFEVVRPAPLALPKANRPLLPVTKDLVCNPYIETFVSQSQSAKKGRALPPKKVSIPFPRLEYDCGEQQSSRCEARAAKRAIVTHRFVCKRK